MERCAQLGQRRVWPPGEQLLQAGLAGGGQEGFATTAIGLRRERATRLELLAHPPHGGDAVTETGGNVRRAFALIVKM